MVEKREGRGSEQVQGTQRSDERGTEGTEKDRGKAAQKQSREESLGQGAGQRG